MKKNSYYHHHYHKRAICRHTTQNMLCTLQNGLYFVNIYRNITDINFPPVTYVYTVQMQQKKKKKKRKKI